LFLFIAKVRFSYDADTYEIKLFLYYLTLQHMRQADKQAVHPDGFPAITTQDGVL
jgi:hypothetical protein